MLFFLLKESTTKYLNYFFFFICFAGIPAQVSPAGTLVYLGTIALDAITAPSPITHPGLIWAPRPIRQLFPIIIGERTKLFFSAICGVIITFDPIIESLPIVTI